MELTLIIFAIVLFVMQSASLKNVRANSLRQNVLTTGISSAVIALCLGVWAILARPVFNGATIGYGMGFGVLFLATVAAYYFAMQTGPLSYTSFFFSASMLIPSVCGLLFWEEPFNLKIGVGIGLFLVAFYFITVFGGAKGGKINGRWLILCLITFICNGSLSVLMNLQQKAMQSAGLPGESTQMMFISFACAAVVALVVYLALLRRPTLAEDACAVKSSLVPIFLVAAGTGGGNLLVAYLTGVAPSSYLFPFVQGSVMVLVTLYSMLFLKEKVNKFGKIGILLGLCAIILINL